MSECRAIQTSIKSNRSSSTDYLAKTFARHIFHGRISARMKLRELVSKHPLAIKADPNVLRRGDIPFVDPARFNNIVEAAISRAVLRTKGTSEPLYADAEQWRRMLISQNYSSDGKDLRVAMHT